jgi:hypothetical protein
MTTPDIKAEILKEFKQLCSEWWLSDPDATESLAFERFLSQAVDRIGEEERKDVENLEFLFRQILLGWSVKEIKQRYPELYKFYIIPLNEK